MKRTSIKKEILTALVLYLLYWSVFFSITVILLSRGKRTVPESASLFIDFLSNSSFVVAIHILFGLVVLLFWIIRYFIRLYKRSGVNKLLKQVVFRFFTPIMVIFITFKTLVFANVNEQYDFEWIASAMNTNGQTHNFYNTDQMHRGMSVFGWGSKPNKDAIAILIKANIEWVAVIPFIDQKDETSKTVWTTVNKNAEWLVRDSVFIRAIKDLHDSGLHVQLKPHLWTFEGWRANLKHQSKKDWNIWFDSYEDYMLYYARLAEHTGVELFCVGTELKSSIKKQPERWKKLIQRMRTIYSGKLTYAANWHDEYEYIDFWEDLDFIGIQAYFPLTKNKTPNLETIEKGWGKHINKLEALHKTYKKPILFTEVGYRSDVSATIKPWEWDSTFSVLHKKKSDKTQQLAFEALFNQLWHKEWFAGVYIWQWDHRSAKENAPKNLDFSPRFKPAENIIAKWFGKPANRK